MSSPFSCVVLSCVGKGLVIGRSPIQGVLPKCLKEFIVSKFISNQNRPEGPIRDTNNNNYMSVL
jgi:hypothetical protein